MSSIINFDKIRKIIQIPDNARILLSKPEKEVTFQMNVHIDKKFFNFDGYAVYYNTVRGPAKGGIRFTPSVTLPPIVAINGATQVILKSISMY